MYVPARRGFAAVNLVVAASLIGTGSLCAQEESW
ncbi:MAG: hypothetical protein ACJAQZ_002946, partial [Planctomycetota bacterium]